MVPDLPPNSSGTSQSERSNPFLDPARVPVEERGLKEWLKRLQELAGRLAFEPIEGGPTQTWDKLLSYGGERPEEFLEDLLRHAESPGVFDGDSGKKRALGRPHLALLLVFLKMLAPAHHAFNQISARHLDLYYRKVLGFEPRPPQADVLHVLFQLHKDSEQCLVRKGSELDAGKDADGKALSYILDADLLVTKARIHRIHTLHKEYRWLTFGEVLEKVWGELPAVKGEIPRLETFQRMVEQRAPEQLRYLNRYMGLDSFDALFEIIREWSSEEDQPVPQQLEVARLAELYANRFRRNWRAQIQRMAPWKEGIRQVMDKVFVQFKILSPDVFQELWNRNLKWVEQKEKPEEERAKELQQQLGLTTAEFSYLAGLKFETLAPKDADRKRQMDRQQQRVVEILADALLEVKKEILPGEKLLRLHSISTNKEAAMAEEGAAWSPFGALENSRKPARMGMVLVSPMLNLPDGQRSIELNVDFEKGLGVFLGKILSLNGSEKEEGRENRDKIIQSILQKALSFSFTTAKGLFRKNPVQHSPAIDRENKRLTWKFTFSKSASPIEPLGKMPQNAAFPATDPALVLRFNNEPVTEAKVHPLELFQGLELKKIALGVEVQDSKVFKIGNEKGVLNPKKPFQPFGREPAAGDNFFLAHPALGRPETSGFSLDITWKGAPRNIGDHYENYQKVHRGKPDTEEALFNPEAKDPLQVPHLKVFAVSPTKEFPLEAVWPLFQQVTDTDSKNEIRIDGTCAISFAPSFPKRKGEALATNPAGTAQRLSAFPDEPTDWPSHFRFELQQPDLQHSNYSRLLTRRTNLLAADLVKELPKSDWAELLLPEPYTPTVRTCSFSYTASQEVAFPLPKKSGLTLFQLEPFGYQEFQPKAMGEEKLWLFASEAGPMGQLLIAVEELKLPSLLSILFQLEPGGEDHDGVLPELLWEYWTKEGWKALDQSQVLEDSTKGLRQSGIIQVKMPIDAARGDHRLPDASYWLRISVPDHAKRFPKCRHISLQAAKAHLLSTDHAEAHFRKPLEGGSVKGLVSRQAGIKSVDQVWPSWGQGSAETGAELYTRIGERLRHKRRPQTTWDYERLVLDAFPEIFKVKCLSWRQLPTGKPGEVGLFLIPDVRGEVPETDFAPPAPFADLALRTRVQEFLQPLCSPETRLSVRNPDYVELQVKAMVNFADGRNPQFYLGQLQRDLARLFSPWAFEAEGDISLGAEIHPTAVAEFIQERDYVDFVLFCQLIQIGKYGMGFAGDGGSPINTGGYPVVFISAPQHNLFILDEETDPRDISLGIGWSQVALDFQIS